MVTVLPSLIVSVLVLEFAGSYAYACFSEYDSRLGDTMIQVSKAGAVGPLGCTVGVGQQA